VSVSISTGFRTGHPSPSIFCVTTECPSLPSDAPCLTGDGPGSILAAGDPSRAAARSAGRSSIVILVTGSAGLVGRAVVRQLMAQGLPVRSLVHEAPLPRLSRFPGSEPEQVVGDVRDPGSLQAACEGVETVIHLVAVLRRRLDGDYRAINVEGTR